MLTYNLYRWIVYAFEGVLNYGALGVCFFFLSSKTSFISRVWGNLMFSICFLRTFLFVSFFFTFTSYVYNTFHPGWLVVCHMLRVYENGRKDDKFINIIKGLFWRWWWFWIVIFLLSYVQEIHGIYGMLIGTGCGWIFSFFQRMQCEAIKFYCTMPLAVAKRN